MKPVGLKSANLAHHRKHEEHLAEIEALEKEISNLRMMSKGEPDFEKAISEKAEKLLQLKSHLEPQDT
jgi:hypothetical protein